MSEVSKRHKRYFCSRAIDFELNIGYNKVANILFKQSIVKRDFMIDCVKGTTVMTVTKNSVIGDVLDYDVETAEFFFAIGMHCLGCPASRGETIEEACAVHGTNADELVEKLNKFFASKSKGE